MEPTSSLKLSTPRPDCTADAAKSADDEGSNGPHPAEVPTRGARALPSPEVLHPTHLEHAADGVEAFNAEGYARFEAQARQLGFDECLVRHWDPGQVLDTHTHPFDVQALVVQGSLRLVQGESLEHLSAGDRFSLAAGIPHAERYGDEGAVFWVARRHPAACR